MKKPPQLRGIYKNGRYYWFSRMITGKRNAVSLETEDLSEAIRRAQDLRDHPILESGDLLVHAVVRYVRECVQSGDWSLATERSKGYFICKWAKEMGARLTPRQVTTEDLKRWHAKRRDKVAESTAFGNLMTIQGFFHWAKEARLCASNPVLALTNRKSNSRIRPPAPAARKDFCIPALRDKLIAEAPRQDLAFILHCGFHAGLRFNEIVEAKGFWFDLDGGHLHLRKHAGIRFKDREERTIPTVLSCWSVFVAWVTWQIAFRSVDRAADERLSQWFEALSDREKWYATQATYALMLALFIVALKLIPL